MQCIIVHLIKLEYDSLNERNLTGFIIEEVALESTFLNCLEKLPWALSMGFPSHKISLFISPKRFSFDITHQKQKIKALAHHLP